MASARTSTAEKTRYTPEDLLRLPDGDRYELVDGNLVERKMSFWSSFVAGTVYALLRTFALAHQLGWVAPEGTSYQCFPGHPGKVRKPDTSFIRLDRLTLEQATSEGHMSVRPDLAVEVVSPNDSYYEVEEKVEEWLGAGVPLVWIINPRTRSVRIRRADGSESMLRDEDELTGEAVIPGFRCRVRELFLSPTGVMLPPA
jgi:Uma2 family endonuclease